MIDWKCNQGGSPFAGKLEEFADKAGTLPYKFVDELAAGHADEGGFCQGLDQ